MDLDQLRKVLFFPTKIVRFFIGMNAAVVKLVYTVESKSTGGNPVRVQVSLAAPS